MENASDVLMGSSQWCQGLIIVAEGYHEMHRLLYYIQGC